MMMLGGDKKKLMTTIVGKLKGDGLPPLPTSTESDSSIGKEAAARKLMSAIKADDAKATVSALEDFFTLFEGEEDVTEGPEAGA